MSLKCRLPASNSRNTSAVHRSDSNAADLATGQICPYPFMPSPYPPGSAGTNAGPPVRSRPRSPIVAPALTTSPERAVQTQGQ